MNGGSTGAQRAGVPSHSCKVRLTRRIMAILELAILTMTTALVAQAAGVPPHVTVSQGYSVRSMEITGFAPEHVVSEGGKVWVIGSSRPESFNHCIIESGVPTTLRTRRYSLAACGAYFAIGGGAIYLAAISFERGTNNDLVHIERFNPTTGHSTVMAPVVMTLVGSAQAHAAFAYADDSLWFRGYGTPGTPSDDLVQVSPSTGAVVRTIADSASPLLTDEPSLLGNGDSLWLASGPGTGTAIATLAPGRFVPTQVYAESGSGGVEWLVAVDGNVWADVTNNGIPHLVELSPTGALLRRTGPQLIGDTPLVIAGTTLWASGVAASCNSPLQVWRVNESTGRATATVTIHTSSNPCVGATGLATAGSFAFQLIGWPATPGMLYRIGTT